MFLRTTYDDFELRVPRCFRHERRSLLYRVDRKIDEINGRDAGATEPEDLAMSKISSRSTTVGRGGESSDSDFDLTKFLDNEKLVPQALQRTTDAEIARETAVKLVQRHIRAMRDRIVVNESRFAPLCVYSD